VNDMPTIDWRVELFRRAFLRHAPRRYALMLSPDEAQRGYIYQLVMRWSEAEAERRQIAIGVARAACWGTLKAKFKLPRYEDLPFAKYADGT
jgi:hypothetical protein